VRGRCACSKMHLIAVVAYAVQRATRNSQLAYRGDAQDVAPRRNHPTHLRDGRPRRSRSHTMRISWMSSRASTATLASSRSHERVSRRYAGSSIAASGASSQAPTRTKCVIGPSCMPSSRKCVHTLMKCMHAVFRHYSRCFGFGVSGLSEDVRHKEAPPYLMEMLLCWSAVASAAGNDLSTV
jgi:hypothetical protein